MFHDPLVKTALPNTSAHFGTPTLVYNLMNLIRSKTFNFNKFVNFPDVNVFLVNNSTLHCDCRSSPFKDKDRNHIITGNLKIIDNIKLYNFFSKGQSNL